MTISLQLIQGIPNPVHGFLHRIDHRLQLVHVRRARDHKIIGDRRDLANIDHFDIFRFFLRQRGAGGLGHLSGRVFHG